MTETTYTALRQNLASVLDRGGEPSHGCCAFCAWPRRTLCTGVASLCGRYADAVNPRALYQV